MPLHAVVIVASWFGFLAVVFFVGVFLYGRRLDRQEREWYRSLRLSGEKKS